ncbi:DctP family TRAP transporter solute-binding subunit [Salinicola halimionae]|uniref:DctP family TRAP transporter solute-binding subunit n=1 Tax=Salinicola halimionae TaxID=1949081 RepID=UPI000DA1F5C0|nr:DctP family TRAP transporter solute-binding subunit [Salinicola halimionae]
MSLINPKTLVGAIGVAILMGGVANAQAQDPIVIKFSHVVANDTPKGQGAQLLQKLVKERLGDKVKIEVYPNSSLYDDTKGLNALLTGDVQLLAPSMAKLGEYSPSVQLMDLPFLFDDMEAVTRFEQGDGGKQILESMQDNNILGLAYWHNGMRQLTSNEPLIEPKDARGMKLRVEPSDVLAAQINELHAIPRKMAFGEVYQGMQTGVIDGQGGNTWSNIYTQKWNEVQSDMTESNNGVLDYMLITNAKFWNGLPDDVRTTLDDILAEVTESVNSKADELNEQAKKDIIAAGGTEVHELTPEQVKAWRDAMSPVLDEYRDEIGSDLVDAAQQSNNAN